jgi:TonB family protein
VFPGLIKVLFLFVLIFFSFTALTAQQAPDTANSPEQIQSRIERARALIAAHRLETAASELESIRATTGDNSLRNITSIMLMNVYLEEGNYGRAEALLEENYRAQQPSTSPTPGTMARSAQKDESLGTYFALAGQAVNGARIHLARYRSFGINTADGNLPAEAVSDLNRLRSLLERLSAQAKEISNVRRAYDSLSLLEDVLRVRLSLARDSEDQARWEAEYATARESLAASQTQIASLGGIPPIRPGQPAVNNIAPPSPYSTKKNAELPVEIMPPPAGASKTGEPPTSDAGSLNAKATKRVVPRYPPIARQKSIDGLVRVFVIVDETGKVVAVSRSEGPLLLRPAAEEAAREWSFDGISTNGRPARVSGYIDFNFTL